MKPPSLDINRIKHCFVYKELWLKALILRQDRDPEKFCVKVNKYFQSDETQSMRKNLKGSIFYGKSIERNVERVCE